MRELLEQKLNRFEELERELLDPQVLANSSRMGPIAREHGSLAKLAMKYRRFKQLNAQIAETLDMIKGSDAEMRELAEAELPQLRAEREKYWDELLDLTIGGEDANRTRCVMEIRAGTGGDEAALFARDLYSMYRHYCEGRRWKVEVLDMNATELGGFKEIYLGLGGEGVYRDLQYESGGHRVQRSPRDRGQGPDSYLRRDYRRASRAGRRRNRHQAGRLPQRSLLRKRSRRATCEQNGVRGPTNALRDRAGRAMPR